jgi:hypothetical protein
VAVQVRDHFQAQGFELWGQLVISSAHLAGFCVLAQAFDQDHPLDQAVHAKNGCEALELMQDAVGGEHITFVQQLLQPGQIIAQGLLQGLEQGQHTIGVTNEFHGPRNGQINRLRCLAHETELQVNTKST